MTLHDSQAAAHPAPPPPPGAEPYGRGPHDADLLSYATLAGEALRPRHGLLEWEWHALPANTEWPAVSAHYAAQVPAGWLADRVREAQHGLQMRAWFGDSNVWAVALLAAEVGSPPVRVLLVGTRVP